jgi:hypothetical protein
MYPPQAVGLCIRHAIAKLKSKATLDMPETLRATAR